MRDLIAAAEASLLRLNKYELNARMIWMKLWLWLEHRYEGTERMHYIALSMREAYEIMALEAL